VTQVPRAQTILSPRGHAYSASDIEEMFQGTGHVLVAPLFWLEPGYVSAAGFELGLGGWSALVICSDRDECRDRAGPELWSGDDA
jgi:hypothetical protein